MGWIPGKRGWCQTITLPQQASLPGQPTNVARITLPYRYAWITVGNRHVSGQGLWLSPDPDVETYGMQWYSAPYNRRYAGPWEGCDVYIKAATAGPMEITVWAAPWFSGEEEEEDAS